MQVSGLEMHLFTQEPKFRKHFDYDKCFCYWCSQTGINEVKPCEEYYGHFTNDRIDLRFDTAWLNQFPDIDDCDNFNYIVIDGKKTLLRNLKDVAELRELLYSHL